MEKQNIFLYNLKSDLQTLLIQKIDKESANLILITKEIPESNLNTLSLEDVLSINEDNDLYKNYSGLDNVFIISYGNHLLNKDLKRKKTEKHLLQLFSLIKKAKLFNSKIILIYDNSLECSLTYLINPLNYKNDNWSYFEYLDNLEFFLQINNTNHFIIKSKEFNGNESILLRILSYISQEKEVVSDETYQKYRENVISNYNIINYNGYSRIICYQPYFLKLLGMGIVLKIFSLGLKKLLRVKL